MERIDSSTKMPKRKATHPPVAKLKDDGLRYAKKPAGSAYASSNTYNGKATRSCFMCGKHKPRDEGEHKKMFGTSQFVCFGCRPKKESL